MKFSSVFVFNFDFFVLDREESRKMSNEDNQNSGGSRDKIGEISVNPLAMASSSNPRASSKIFDDFVEPFILYEMSLGRPWV